MNTLRKLLTITFLFTTLISKGQSKNTYITLPDSANVIFKDTLFNIAFDSVIHDVGLIKPTNENNKLIKYFKYIGPDTIYISRTWTGDPHFICKYPKELLIPNKIYSYTVCFWHQGGQGKINKVMGFNLSDGNRVILKFKGEYLSVEGKE